MSLAEALFDREPDSRIVLRDGIVAAVSPLTVIVPPSTVASPAAQLDSCNPSVGDFVQVLVQGANRLVIGSVGSSAFKGYAKVTADQTPIASTTLNLTGLTVTFTAETGRMYRLAAHAWFISTVTGDTVRLSITDASNNVLMISQAEILSTSGTPTVGGFALHTFSAGSTTVKCRAARQTGSGTLTMQAGATFPACLTVEDIGPA